MCTRYSYNCQYPENRSRLSSAVHENFSSPNRGSSTVPNQESTHGTKRKAGEEDSPQRGDRDGISARRHGTDVRNDVWDRASIFGDRGMLDPVKSRFVGQSSASAFARNLGIELQSAKPPSLHCFGWNCGIRPEENSASHQTLRDLISLTDLAQFTAVYFSIMHPVIGILNQEAFKHRCDLYWTSLEPDLVFESVISGVVALGSFMCVSRGHPRELDLVQHAKDVLEDPRYTRRPSLDQVTAWILRTLYLRSTTRPYNSWLASCTTLHLAEATGLHQETTRVILTTEHSGEEAKLVHPEQTRRLFWVAWFMNAVISYEYSLAPVNLLNVTCRPISPTSGDVTPQLVLIAKTIPSSQPHTSSSTHKAELNQAIEDLMAIEDTHPFLALTKADLCFCIYRRLHLFKEVIRKEVVMKIIELGNNAAKAGLHLAQNNQPWWQLVGCGFQHICVLLALDTTDSLANVDHALKTLEKVVQIFNTHMTLEALATAKLLVNDAMARKRRDLALLENTGVGETTTVEHENNTDLNWDEFFDPSYGAIFDTPQFSSF
jgi:hypothetical protein